MSETPEYYEVTIRRTDASIGVDCKARIASAEALSNLIEVLKVVAQFLPAREPTNITPSGQPVLNASKEGER